jgi:hypothetical protein
MMRRVFRPKTKDRINNDELHNFFSSPFIIKLIKARMMGWAAIHHR